MALRHVDLMEAETHHSEWMMPVWNRYQDRSSGEPTRLIAKGSDVTDPSTWRFFEREVIEKSLALLKDMI